MTTTNTDEDSDEDVFVMVNVDETISDTQLLSEISKGYILNAHTDRPIVQLNDTHFEGRYHMPLGTPILMNILPDQNPGLEFLGLVRNTLDLEQIHFKSKSPR
ncbi:hypothetical protein GJ496_010816 [Pomphorhynchus laevis]|nr:hypothetical protein GJ496_010816 [Pomphorhynchus laevis]